MKTNKYRVTYIAENGEEIIINVHETSEKAVEKLMVNLNHTVKKIEKYSLYDVYVTEKRGFKTITTKEAYSFGHAERSTYLNEGDKITKIVLTNI